MNVDPEELEDLVAQALVVLEADGEAALERLCSDHPAHAAAPSDRHASDAAPLVAAEASWMRRASV